MNIDFYRRRVHFAKKARNAASDLRIYGFTEFGPITSPYFTEQTIAHQHPTLDFLLRDIQDE